MEKAEREQQHKSYIKNLINPIIEKLVVDLLIQKPSNAAGVLEFIKGWCDDKGAQIAGNLDKGSSKGAAVNAYGEHSDEESGSEDEDQVEMLSIEAIQQKKDKMKISVSAEAFGQFNKKGNYVPKFIQKSAEQIERIKKRLSQAFMFSALDEKEQQIVIGAFEEKKFHKGDVIIKQGDDGDNLYVIDQGELDCFKKFKPDENEKFLKVYQPGEAFGELALLYNAPRAATIIAKTESVLFSLDRDCFNNIVKDAAAKKRESYESLLGKIELLDTMDPYERSKIADALKPLKFKAGEYVVKEGEKGDSFFFVEDGQAIATKVVEEGQQPQEVYRYKTGDYFGELALLRDQPRAANIIAVTDLKLVYLERQSFKRLIGPLEELLKRNFARYTKFVS